MEGLIFIPDITGFTSFVKKIDINVGVSITQDLLNEIIDNNELNLELSEIEGDAILFYKLGRAISLEEIFNGFKKMYEAFNRKYHWLRSKYNLSPELSLKFVLHYGEINIYHIKGFKKLYGQSVIESHRLLKNGANCCSYILITDDYMKALKISDPNHSMDQSNFASYTSQAFTDLREISYYFFHYSNLNTFADHPHNGSVRA